jgi:hypothetical protein
LTAYVFTVDALNFCFWPNNKAGLFEYEHMTRNLEKLLKERPDFFLPQNLAKLTQEEVTNEVFGGKADFALLDERARLLR